MTRNSQSSRAPFPHTLRPARRLSLVAQVVATLKEFIASNSTGERLPGERELCAQLGVSRMTLRTALARLAAEGLISGGKGRRHRIVGRPKHSRRAAAGKAVVLLSPLPLPALDPRVLFWIDELRQALAKEGYQLDFLNQRSCYAQHPEHALKALTSRLPAAWVLYLSTHKLQAWFADSGLPAVISGSRYPDVRLPSVDVDYRATCRHAVGRLLAGGHRRLVLLNPQSVAGGDIESELGFREASAAAGPDVVSSVAYHDGTVRGICARLDTLRQREQFPTGFLVSRPSHALTALGHLIRNGVHFPDDAALIARDHDSFLEHVVPSMARYQADPVLFAHKLSRAVLEMASGGDARPRDYRLIPRLIKGQTLG